MKVVAKKVWAWPEMISVCEVLGISRESVASLVIDVQPNSVTITRNGEPVACDITGRRLFENEDFLRLLQRFWGHLPKVTGIYAVKVLLNVGDAAKLECGFFASDTMAEVHA